MENKHLQDMQDCIFQADYLPGNPACAALYHPAGRYTHEEIQRNRRYAIDTFMEAKRMCYGQVSRPPPRHQADMDELEAELAGLHVGRPSQLAVRSTCRCNDEPSRSRPGSVSGQAR